MVFSQCFNENTILSTISKYFVIEMRITYEFFRRKEQYQERFQLATDRIRQIREECNSSSKESFNDPAITEKQLRIATRGEAFMQYSYCVSSFLLKDLFFLSKENEW